ncbi:plasmid stabilisation system family protein (plasmid) [Acidiphilium multivorum AIU301]|uniref:Plasmid stabilisation system family protein n=1 Tax=Acidiphilium multivorum (strain DSM 11245 / JCM 8867 / NBRC 100883 / AIU 301) TaxID=926570 RepID=F0J865_ACIMA|nr:type II toxin-antitoxin system RelE/ParE family toxin [Acidiphilium multivorum]BAJ83282.1 plasmid stabilisation system family protein [Acidiphilium multivorum AIU301]GAN72720.1 plasmid stabilization protein [Acidiphilium multivorum AIU301]
MPVIFTAEALDDLAHIRQHIGRENPHAATRVAVQLVAACDRLEYLPERGRPGLVSGTRELTVIWPYVIVYRISASSVEILRVWHGAQDRDGC